MHVMLTYLFFSDFLFFFFNDPPTTEIYTLPLHDALPIFVACVCGSDLWSYRGINDVPKPMAMGHEYVGVVEEVGSEVRTLRPGQYVVGPQGAHLGADLLDRKSTRLNSSHGYISYAVFCLK